MTRISFLLTSFLLCLVIWLWVSTETGFRLTYQLIKPHLPANLSIGEIKGHLIGPITINDLQWKDENQKIKVNKLKIDWEPLALLTVTFKLNDVNAEGVTIHYKQKTKETKKQQTFELPLKIKGENINVSNIKIVHDEQKTPIAFQTIYTKTFKLTNNSVAIKGQIKQTSNAQSKFDIYLKWFPKIAWTLILEGRVNTGLLSTDWPGEMSIALKTKGIKKNKQYTGRFYLSKLNGNIRNQSLSGKSRIDFRKNIFDIQPSTIQWGKNIFYLSGRIGKFANVQWKINAPHLGQVIPETEGSIQTQGHIEGKRQNPMAIGNIKARNVISHYFKDLHLEKLDTQFSISKNKIQLRLDAKQVKVMNNLLSSTINIRGIPTNHHIDFVISHKQNQIRGNIQARFKKSTWNATIHQLSVSTPNTPQWRLQRASSLSISRKQIKLDTLHLQSGNQQLTLSGDYKKVFHQPRLHADLNIQHASFQLPWLKTKFTNIQIQASARPNGIIEYNGRANAGTQIIRVSGKTYYRKRFFPTELTLDGNNILIYNTPEYRIFLTPNLKFTYINKQPYLSGTIAIPYASITPYEFKNVVTPSEDIVFVDEEKPEEKLQQHFSMDIELQLGKQIYINSQGLTGFLTGNLKITSQSGQPIIGNGKLILNKGQYTAFGKALTISKGELQYLRDPITNPHLKIIATNKVNVIPSQLTAGTLGSSVLSDVAIPETIIVGVDIQGTLKRPNIRLFSSPAGFSQSDILSLLLTGRPIRYASATDAALILQAANSLDPTGSTSQFNHLQQSLQSTLGLDELRIGSQQQINPETGEVVQGTSLILGKQITPRLYVNYSVGLFGTLSSLKANYKIYRQLMLQGETNTYGSGIDLLYSLQSKK